MKIKDILAKLEDIQKNGDKDGAELHYLIADIKKIDPLTEVTVGERIDNYLIDSYWRENMYDTIALNDFLEIAQNRIRAELLLRKELKNESKNTKSSIKSKPKN